MRAYPEKQNKPDLKSSTNFETSNTLRSIPGPDSHPLLHLQHTIGNQAVLRSLKPRSDGLESGSDIENGQTTERQFIAHEPASVSQQTASAASIPPSSTSQQNIDTQTEANWNKLSAPIREEVEELDKLCDGWIAILTDVQMRRSSSLRSEWLNQLRQMSRRIGDLDSDGKFASVEKAFSALTDKIGHLVYKFGDEWSSLEKRYSDERRWLLSTNVRSTDSIQAVKYLEEVYRQAKPAIRAYLTDEDYAILKQALENQEYIRVGALRGARIRAQELKQMMNTVAALLRKGEDANKFIPGWSDRVSEEAAYLESFAIVAKENGRDYAGELADLRRELLEEQRATSKVKPPEKSVLDKGGDFVAGVVEAIGGIFVEAAKQAVDLVQINLHFVTLGKYEPRFISDLAAAAEQGETTGDLLKGMVTGLIDTPSRFLKACRDGDWEAIGRESVHLYMLAKTVKEAPRAIEKIPEVVKKLPDLLAHTQASLRILRSRTVALGLKSEARLPPEPVPRTPPTPKPPPDLVVKQGGGQGSGKPTGMLRDTDAPGRGVKVDTSHPVVKNTPAANDNAPPPPPQAQQAVGGTMKPPQDLPPAQQTGQGTHTTGQTTDPARMGKKPPTSTPKPKDPRPPAAELDPGEGDTTRKPRRNARDQDDLPRKEKISDTYNKSELEQSPQLIERLPDPNHRRLYMEWLKKGHIGKGHPHINPAKDLDGSLRQFSEETGIKLKPK